MNGAYEFGRVVGFAVLGYLIYRIVKARRSK